MGEGGKVGAIKIKILLNSTDDDCVCVMYEGARGQANGLRVLSCAESAPLPAASFAILPILNPPLLLCFPPFQPFLPGPCPRAATGVLSLGRGLATLKSGRKFRSEAVVGSNPTGCVWGRFGSVGQNQKLQLGLGDDRVNAWATEMYARTGLSDEGCAASVPQPVFASAYRGGCRRLGHSAGRACR